MIISQKSKTITFAMSPYTITNNDCEYYNLLEVDTTNGSVVVNLPDRSSNNGKDIEIRHSIQGSTNTVTVNSTGADTITSWSRTTYELYNVGDSMSLFASSITARYEILDKNFSEILHVRDEKADGTNGGTFTSGAWRTRDLNTIVKNTIYGSSLSLNAVTLPAGRYKLKASCPAYSISWHKAALYNSSDAVYIDYGSSDYSASACNTKSVVLCDFVISSSKIIELHHRSSASQSSNGFGLACTFGVIEIYSELEIERLS